MNAFEEETDRTAFHTLTPDRVILMVEQSLGTVCTNLFRTLNSYINRVYELEREDGGGLVVKFYRPGRWSQEALQDEHDFLLELAAEEIPVIPPLRLGDGGTLGDCDGVSFAVFPRKSGRSYDEYTIDQWQELGRLMGRVHAVGARHAPKDRITMAPDRSAREQVEYVCNGGLIPPDLKGEFKEAADTLLTEITPLFEGVEMIRIHGDCHYSNLIHRPDESFYVIDFDDMALGPPIQDFWMLLPGFRRDSIAEINYFLEGYGMFRTFDRGTLRLIGPLRAMRYIHYMAWCAHQVAEDGFSRAAPDFGSHEYWRQEIRDLSEQLERIRGGADRGEPREQP